MQCYTHPPLSQRIVHTSLDGRHSSVPVFLGPRGSYRTTWNESNLIKAIGAKRVDTHIEELQKCLGCQQPPFMTT